ncbi:NUDIX domain-containing protein [Haloechinothrix sp. LS1_15]|uniref:NUDIX hydrolase n=1 Tax=Haloechinothrix sp. LS1_15 TaxID=2652248 RepID=UPI0029458AD0|nr:NUDIX domain-containing protein [Haloechinothrix sp. LS1_15]MDV6014522.1 NUDIX domain-containing protein [Haloechinothrix sp. LS1_15]
MAKADYYDDPEAPLANSLVVAVGAVVRDEHGRVLMIERTDNGLWAVPGGAQEIGETTRQAVLREIHEETGIEVELTGIVGIYSDPRHVIAYDDGEVRQEFAIIFHARPTGGAPRPSIESRRVHWVPPDELEALTVAPAVRLRLRHALEGRGEPYLD